MAAEADAEQPGQAQPLSPTSPPQPQKPKVCASMHYLPLGYAPPPRTGSLLGIPNDHIGYFGYREEFLAVVMLEATV